MITPTMRLATALVCGTILFPIGALAEGKPKPEVQANATPPTCPYLQQGRDENTGSTTATFNPSTKILNIQVNRSVPGMFWGMAESRTRASADKILANCPEISTVEVNFKSGQKLTHRRDGKAPQ
jgi:hypothetical protein